MTAVSMNQASLCHEFVRHKILTYETFVLASLSGTDRRALGQRYTRASFNRFSPNDVVLLNADETVAASEPRSAKPHRDPRLVGPQAPTLILFKDLRGLAIRRMIFDFGELYVINVGEQVPRSDAEPRGDTSFLFCCFRRRRSHPFREFEVYLAQTHYTIGQGFVQLEDWATFLNRCPFKDVARSTAFSL